jgi:hypothetical protein
MHTISPAITQYASPQRGVVESAVISEDKAQP